MERIIQRIYSYFTPPAAAKERVEDMQIELQSRGIDFEFGEINEDGHTYMYARSKNYPRGFISATGKDVVDLEAELKDAIFSAFGVPSRYCNYDLITFNPALTVQTVKNAQSVHATA